MEAASGFSSRASLRLGEAKTDGKRMVRVWRKKQGTDHLQIECVDTRKADNSATGATR